MGMRAVQHCRMQGAWAYPVIGESEGSAGFHPRIDPLRGGTKVTGGIHAIIVFWDPVVFKPARKREYTATAALHTRDPPTTLGR